MKKLCIGLISMFSILAGTTAVAVAGCQDEQLVVRFSENNTILVTSPTMTEARLYTNEGRLLERGTGKIVRFELERGEYILFADTECKTISKKVVLK